MKKIKTFELFAGIGAPRKALTNLNIPYESLGYSEIEKGAISQYNLIHNDTVDNNWGDITKIDKLPNDIDLLFHGSPCQSFSMAGCRSGGEQGSGTKSSLMWETVRLVEQSLPKVVIWENVTGVLTKKMLPTFNEYLKKMEEFGYNNSHKVINAVDAGVPQNRKRVFVVSSRSEMFNFDNITYREKRMITDFVDFDNISDTPPSDCKTFKNSFAKCKLDRSIYHCEISARYSNGENGLYSPTITQKKLGKQNKGKWEFLTNEERYLLSGFTSEDYNKVAHLPKTNLIKATGNTIVVPVLELIFEELYKDLLKECDEL